MDGRGWTDHTGRASVPSFMDDRSTPRRPPPALTLLIAACAAALPAACRPAAQTDPQLTSLITGFRANSPQYHIDLDRAQAKTIGVSLADINEALQVYLESSCVVIRRWVERRRAPESN